MNTQQPGWSNVAVAAPGWYPDPGRAHEFRYFDGTAWTDHVSDHGQPGHAALGRPPVKVPRVKMWILAVLSLFIFTTNTPGTKFAVPLGVVFAIWCWAVTKEPWRAHRDDGSSAATEIKAARIVSACLASLCVFQALIFMR